MKDRFTELRTRRSHSDAELVVTAFEVDQGLDHYFGLSLQGDLFILLTSHDSKRGENKVIEFPKYEHIQIFLDQQMTIEFQNGLTERKTFQLVRFRSEDESIMLYFLRYMSGMVDAIGGDTTFSNVVSKLKGAMSLFKLVAQPAKLSIQGLWAELMIILISKSPQKMVESWHAVNSGLWDFHSSSRIVEVKSTVGVERIHVFQNEQLKPPEGIDFAVVASFLLHRSDDGASVLDLMEEIKAKVDLDAWNKLCRLVHELLGNSIAQSDKIRFDRVSALSQLRYFDMRQIPSISTKNVPEQISKVQYRVNFKTLSPVNPIQI